MTPTPNNEALAALENILTYVRGKDDLYANGAIRQFAEEAVSALASAVPEGLPWEQEPKYTVNGSAIVNRASGEAIPADEPVFIFRARDKWAAGVLGDYANFVEDPAHRAAVQARFIQFSEWAEAHPERMKEPDTAASPTQTASADPDMVQAFRASGLKPAEAVTAAQHVAASKAPTREALAELHAVVVENNRAGRGNYGELFGRLMSALAGAQAALATPLDERLDASGTPMLPATLLEQQAIRALNMVKAWRDSDGNEPFPHEARELIDALLMMAEQRRTGI